MSQRFKIAIIDDLTSSHIEGNMQANLLDLFESAIKSVAPTLVREAKFEMSDFATAKVRGCECFSLLVTRIRADSGNEWFGVFERGNERLEVICHLE